MSLLALLLDAAAGRFPPADGAVALHGRPAGRAARLEARKLLAAGRPVGPFSDQVSGRSGARFS